MLGGSTLPDESTSKVSGAQLYQQGLHCRKREPMQGIGHKTVPGESTLPIESTSKVIDDQLYQLGLCCRDRAPMQGRGH